MNTFNLSKNNFKETQLPHVPHLKKQAIDKRKALEERKFKIELRRIGKEAAF